MKAQWHKFLWPFTTMYCVGFFVIGFLVYTGKINSYALLTQLIGLLGVFLVRSSKGAQTETEPSLTMTKDAPKVEEKTEEKPETD